MADDPQDCSADQNNHGPDFDPTKERNEDRDPSEVESEPDKDVVSLDALTPEELQYIVENSKYRDTLSDLLSPYAERISELGSVYSADHTVTDDQSELGANPVTVHKLHAGQGADTSSSSAKSRALKRPSDSSSSHAKKKRRISPEVTRKRKSGSGTHTSPAKKPRISPQPSGSSESEDESFDPSLEREDKDEFKVKVPRTIEKYIDKHFRRALSKEERTAMLKRHPKPDVEAAVPPRLDGFVADFAGKKSR